MTDQTNTPEPTTETVSVGVEFFGGERMAAQMVMHGMAPQILIQVERDDADPDHLHAEIKATGPEDREDLAEFFRLMAEVLENGRDADDGGPEGPHGKYCGCPAEPAADQK